MYLYIETGWTKKDPSFHLLAKGTEKKLDKLWNDINRLNKGNLPYIFMTVKPLPRLK